MLDSSSSRQERGATVRIERDDHVVHIFGLVAFLGSLGRRSWLSKAFSERVVLYLQLSDLWEILMVSLDIILVFIIIIQSVAVVLNDHLINV